MLSTWCDASVLDEEVTVNLDVEFYNYLGELFNALQPIVLPGFTFAWISLISHRMYLPAIRITREERLCNIGQIIEFGFEIPTNLW